MLIHQKAFTLIELLVTLTVLGVVVGLAVPSFNAQILSNKSIALGEDFASALNVVRSEAVKRAHRVSMCASTNGATCSSGPADWTQGFIAVVDYATADSAAAPLLTDATHPVSTILHVWEKRDLKADITVTRNNTAISFIRYNTLGTLARISNDAIIIDAEMHNCKGNVKQQITIGLAGLVSVARKACTVY